MRFLNLRLMNLPFFNGTSTSKRGLNYPSLEDLLREEKIELTLVPQKFGSKMSTMVLGFASYTTGLP